MKVTNVFCAYIGLIICLIIWLLYLSLLYYSKLKGVPFFFREEIFFSTGNVEY